MGLKKWEESFSFYTRGITQFPDSAYAYHHRAILLATLRYNDEAIADNTKALELVEKDSLRLMLFINRGTNYSQKRAFQKAYEDYYRAYLIDTSNTAVLNNMATVLDELGRREEAIVQLKKIIRIDSTFVGSYVNLGFQYTKLGKYKEAIEFFDKALSIEKDEPLTLNNRGLAKYYLTDYKGALNDINKSISIYPANSYAFKNRALVYIALKQTDKACIDIQAALDKGFTEMYGNEVIDLQKANCPAK
jgi:tetratricopeptide (TPR) repeat protein